MARVTLVRRIEGCLRVTLEAARLRLLGFSRAARPLLEECPSAADTRGHWEREVDTLLASGRLPWSTCLTRSCALARQLRRRGVPAVLRLGVGLPRAGLEAHAWVEVDGHSINEPASAHAHLKPLPTP